MSESSVLRQFDRVQVASFSTYFEAESAVDYLSDRKFPVDRVAIVGHDVKYVEQVVGRMNYGRAALTGAINGGLLGLLLYALQRVRRDFAAIRGLQPTRYDVVADAEVADDAARLLRERRIA
jgi:hypothetical protein